MIFALFLINATLLAVALFNFATMRRPLKSEQVTISIQILLPVRNEAENIERVLSELSNQQHLLDCKVLVIDDNSEDQTYLLAKRFESEQIEIIKAPIPTQGWIGKVSALQAGFQYLVPHLADIVISIDADVHFEPDAIARAVSSLNAADLDFISPYPRQIASSWAERLIQPLLQWSWMSTVLLRGAEKFPLKSTVICNGQFLVMRGSSLKSIGGFESVAHKVLDDIELGRSFVAAGFRGSVIDGSEISSTRMYSSFDEIKNGYGKSLHTAFGSLFGALFASLFMTATGIFPLLYSLSGNLIAIAALLAIIGTRFISAAASSTRLRDSILHPLSSALFIYLLYFSWRNRGKTQWKGRTL
jgi:glycosyltransferase involved in cell wall biosynthesis